MLSSKAGSICLIGDISVDEFWNVVNKFRGTMWKKEGNEWVNSFHKEIKEQIN